ncbi:MAG TPA: O-methyltransferase [Thermoanaerobaculia bacterium]|nr:O-methyltransferase [Thermoanaerobaculia bacterium]
MGNDASGIGQSDPAVAGYLESLLPEDAVLVEIRQRSGAAGLPDIQVARLDGRHLEAIARAAGARKIVEIGTLGGYSGVCLARALPEGGTLDTFEFEPKHAEVAAESFRRAGLGTKVRIHLGRATEKLPEIEKDGPFDVVFVDADKAGYPDYYRWAARHLRRGGVLLADNVFRAAFGPNENWSRESVESLDRFNRLLSGGSDFVPTFIPTLEGMAMGVKK